MKIFVLIEHCKSNDCQLREKRNLQRAPHTYPPFPFQKGNGRLRYQ